MLTTAEAQRLQWQVKASAEDAEMKRVICAASKGLTGLIGTGAFAAIGNVCGGQAITRRAYEEHKLYHQENEAKRSAEREARARILQMTFDAEEARKDSEYFKEMALRDPANWLA